MEEFALAAASYYEQSQNKGSSGSKPSSAPASADYIDPGGLSDEFWTVNFAPVSAPAQSLGTLALIGAGILGLWFIHK